MSSKTKTPKTGLAKRMREWMRGRKRPFTSADIADALGVPSGAARERVATVMYDFIRRGEVLRQPENRKNRKTVWRYRYNPAWRLEIEQPKADRIYKAMRLSSFKDPFALSDIQRLTGQDRNYIDKLAKQILAGGYLRREGYRPRKTGYGREAVYRITDTNRFFIEVMK